MCSNVTNYDYMAERTSAINQEKNQFFGEKLTLNEKEKRLDDKILILKKNELNKFYENSSQFYLKRDFFESKPLMESSKIFQLIKKMPKGHSLHTHFLAGVSASFIVNNISYMENLYAGYQNGNFKLKFFNKKEVNSEWTLVKEMRILNPDFDKSLEKKLTLEEEIDNNCGVEEVWKKFRSIFTTLYDMVAYKPVFEIYLFQLLQELYDDNVMYTELRGTFMPLYDLSKIVYTTEDFFNTIIEVESEFKKSHPDFIGVKYIHSIYRGVDSDVLKSKINELVLMQRKFPDLIIGFDFVGFEDEGKKLFDFSEILIDAKKHLKFFFHAGESNWFGHTDLNVIDAVLLNCTRIGHGLSFSNHPVALELAQKRNIAVELCPISNQMLQLVEDPRNHPVIHLLTRSYPVVICNDDPSIWNATGLSYDWFMTFMAMTPANCGVKVLKQFAMNSIIYSFLSDVEKKRAMSVWTDQWNKFVDEAII